MHKNTKSTWCFFKNNSIWNSHCFLSTLFPYSFISHGSWRYWGKIYLKAPHKSFWSSLWITLHSDWFSHTAKFIQCLFCLLYFPSFQVVCAPTESTEAADATELITDIGDVRVCNKIFRMHSNVRSSWICGIEIRATNKKLEKTYEAKKTRI